MNQPKGKRGWFSRTGIPMLTAVISALLLHGLLLVMFRHAPAPESSSSTDLPTVSRIDLSDPANQQFVRWLASHDPARMIMPDTQIGFSSVAVQPVKHKILEDLPRLPHLSVPRTPAPAPVPARLRDAVSTLPENSTAYYNAVLHNKAASGAIQLNDRLLPDSAKYLRLFPLPEPTDKIRNVSVIKIGKTRLDGLATRLRIAQSSGDAQADMAALKIARKYLATANAPRLGGEMIFIWSGSKNQSGAAEL